jgi:hypothetical protein
MCLAWRAYLACVPGVPGTTCPTSLVSWAGWDTGMVGIISTVGKHATPPRAPLERQVLPGRVRWGGIP